MVQWSGPLGGGRCSPSTTQALVGRGCPIGCCRSHCGTGLATCPVVLRSHQLRCFLCGWLQSWCQAGLVGSRKC
eukprot:scaffold137309_cov169-Phaeocystis_antarctica.AAC.1